MGQPSGQQVHIDQKNIQGLVFTGYPDLPCAAFVLLSVAERERAGRWLAELLRAGTVTDGRKAERTQAVNLAFSHAGLAAWGLTADALASFPREFSEGMAGSETRSRILGDTDASAPETWAWGRRPAPPVPGGLRPASDVHVMLMLYAKSDAGLRDLLAAQRRAYEGALREVFLRDTQTLPDKKEHFGFADGISQPRIEGSESTRKEGLTFVKPGEFILGQHNEYDQLPSTPTVASGSIADQLLPDLRAEGDDDARTGRRDLGANGSYLVARQLEQHVAAFWDTMSQHSGAAGGQAAQAEAVRLAAKCVGRWPSGAPLALAPERDDPALGAQNQFGYDDDPTGLKCPIGAHIRRANPRDSLEPGAEESKKLVQRHMIMRRGRSYGTRLAPFQPEATPGERGLFFVAVNSNIRRQFEFIQQTWLNSAKFDGLHEGSDPISGGRELPTSGDFSIPEQPVRRRLTGLPAFVTTRGGEYFFLPGLPALAYLSKIGVGADVPKGGVA